MAAFPHPAAQGICILTTVSVEGAAVPHRGFQMVMLPQAGRCIWQAYIWNEAVTLSPTTARLGKKNMDSPDPKRSCPFSTVTNYSWQFVTLSRVSSPLPHYLQGQNQVRKTYKSEIPDFSSLSLAIQRARNSKRKSTPPPEVFSTSRLYHTGSPQLWVHLAANVYSALPH